MSLDRHASKRFCSCDGCGDELKAKNGKTFLFANDEFDVFLEHLKEEGWLAVKDNKGIWQHLCPDCQ